MAFSLILLGKSAVSGVPRAVRAAKKFPSTFFFFGRWADYRMGRFEKLYSEHVGAVFRFARSCVDRREVAEEIVSEVFLTLFRNLDRVEDSSLPAWLLTVTRRRAADYWRRWFLELKQQSWPVEGQQAAGQPTIPLAEWLAGCPQLTAVHRACLILRYAHGMNRVEIGERLGMTDNQVKGHLQYALELLRKEMKGSKAGGASERAMD